MSNFKLEFKLKQHTPLIHFQHDQHGATLRATELKPKLDRFIMKKIGGKDKIPDEWLIDKDKNALDYKVSIHAEDVELTSISKKDKLPMYFGDIGNDNNPKVKSYTKNHISVKFSSFIPSLLKNY